MEADASPCEAELLAVSNPSITDETAISQGGCSDAGSRPVRRFPPIPYLKIDDLERSKISDPRGSEGVSAGVPRQFSPLPSFKIDDLET